jgi:hypothetical protein
MGGAARMIPSILNRVNSGINGSHSKVSLINSIVGNLQFDCSGMGSGDFGIPWMCAISASTNAEKNLRESSGLVISKVPFNQFRKFLVTYF